MPKKPKGETYELLKETMPRPTDRLGCKLYPGDFIVYPVRKQADMRIVTGRVRDWKWEVVVETEEKFCSLKIWMIAHLENNCFVPRKTMILQPERVVKITDKEALNTSKEMKMLSEVPIN